MVKKILSDWYVKGKIQLFVTFLIFFVTVLVLSYFWQYVCHDYVLKMADTILPAHNVMLKDVLEIKRLIKATSVWPFLSFSCLLVLGVLLFLRRFFSTRVNFVGSVTLDKALRFTDALEGLGLKQDWEQFYFVQHYDIPVYIAAKPLLSAEAFSVKATVYPYTNTRLASTSYLNEHKGSKHLCLKATDLDEVLNQLTAGNSSTEPETATPTLSDLQAERVELKVYIQNLEKQLDEAKQNYGRLEDEIRELKSENKSLQSLEKQLDEAKQNNGRLVDEIGKLKSANQSLQSLGQQLDEAKQNNGRLVDKIGKLKSANQSRAMAEGKENKNVKRVMLCSLALAPIFYKLKEGTKHNRADLTAVALEHLFKTSLEKTKSLQRLLEGLDDKESTQLPVYIRDYFWENLKTLDLTSLGGPQPAGALQRLKKIIFESG
jgi:predicted  nucleic acid-binding Zn-ribbon protein